MSSKRILLIDGNIATLKQARVTLEFEGFEVHQALDGTAGIAEARRLRPAVVLVSTTLQKLNGYDVCRTIRRDRQLCATHVLLTTSSMDIFDEGRARRAGATGHLAKPFLPSQLLARISEMLNSEPPRAEPDPADEASPSSSDSGDEPTSLEPRFVFPLGLSSGDPLVATGELPSGSIELIEDSGEMMADLGEGVVSPPPDAHLTRGDLERLVDEAVRRHLDRRLPDLVEHLVARALDRRDS